MANLSLPRSQSTQQSETGIPAYLIASGVSWKIGPLLLCTLAAISFAQSLLAQNLQRTLPQNAKARDPSGEHRKQHIGRYSQQRSGVAGDKRHMKTLEQNA